MEDRENTFPMDIASAAPGRWRFRPTGYLVVILPGSDAAQGAAAALNDAGFDSRDVKLYSGEEILENYEMYRERRTLAGKLVGTIADDLESRDIYLAYAREGRSALWLRLPDEADVPRALRVLAAHEYVHTRYYGPDKETDFRVS